MLKNQDIKVIDDALKFEDFEYLRSIMWSDEFPWFMSEGYANTTQDQKDLGIKFTHIFYNGFYSQSNYLPLLHPIMNILQPRAFVRVQAVITPKADKLIKTGYHRDMTDCVTAIYYLNTTNGNLHFKDGPEIETKENRLVIFNSNLHHSGTKCTDSERRTLINFNYYERAEQDYELKF